MNSHSPSILIVDDDETLCSLLQEYLRAEGMQVDVVHSGVSALRMLEAQHHYQAIILDIMMPGMSGIEVLQNLRPHNSVPIIMLTGRGDDIDRILGLEMGADDYLTKPCNPRELLARIRAVLRRTHISTALTHDTLCLHGITLDTGLLSALVNGQPLAVTSVEFHTLQLLMQSAGNTISKETLTEEVLKRKLSAYDRSIDVHISRLRQKLIMHGVHNIIKSVRGIGYQLITEIVDIEQSLIDHE